MSDTKEVELAKRGVEAFVDRANELHHQGRHVEALKQLEVILFSYFTIIVFLSVLAEFAKKSLGQCIIAPSKSSSF